MMARLTLDTPLGPLALASDGERLIGVGFGSTLDNSDDVVLAEAARQFTAYFLGKLWLFDLPLAPAASSFQQRVRHAMLAIPYGGKAGYGQLAAAIGSAPRAVGQACGRNPLPIVVPCHRVLGANGIGGYSGGAGLPTKRWLLDHEARAKAAA